VAVPVIVVVGPRAALVVVAQVLVVAVAVGVVVGLRGAPVVIAPVRMVRVSVNVVVGRGRVVGLVVVLAAELLVVMVEVLMRDLVVMEVAVVDRVVMKVPVAGLLLEQQVAERPRGEQPSPGRKNDQSRQHDQRGAPDGGYRRVPLYSRLSLPVSSPGRRAWPASLYYSVRNI
jgi:hypothetical protein